MKESKPNFWIPDNEVEKLDRTLRGRSRPHAVIHTEHGAKLCKDLDRIRENINEELSPKKGEIPTNDEIANAVKTLAKY